MRIFNSTFENSLRMLLLLSCLNCSSSLDRLYVLDFLSIYGKDFQISRDNLNGDNEFRYSELPTRKAVCRNALRELVLQGYARPIVHNTELLYEITEAGKQYADSLESEYAFEYMRNARNARDWAGSHSDKELIRRIKDTSIRIAGDIHE